MSTLHAIPASGPTLPDPGRTRAVHAIYHELESALESSRSDLDMWMNGTSEPELVLENARDEAARTVDLFDVLKTLGPPLPRAQLDELGA